MRPGSTRYRSRNPQARGFRPAGDDLERSALIRKR